MGRKRVERVGWLWVRLAMVGGWSLSGCNLGLGTTPDDARNRLQEELAASRTNVFEYEGVWDKSQGGLGPYFQDLHLTVKTTPRGDSLDIARTGTHTESGRSPMPPSRYRRDSPPPTGMGAGSISLRASPADSRARWNGDTLDRQAICGKAKGLLAAYPAGLRRPPPLTP